MVIRISAYRGSTTPKKKRSYQGMSWKKTKASLLQEGANSISREKEKHVHVFVDNYNNFLKTVDEKFNPDISILIEITTIWKCQNIEMAIEGINQFNVKIEGYSKKHGKNLTWQCYQLKHNMLKLQSFIKFILMFFLLTTTMVCRSHGLLFSRCCCKTPIL